MAKKIVRPILTYADEAHHVPADTYQKVMKHFTPKLWLGMTATPDKRDDNIEGRNVYELFDHQIAYEIRLQQAMEENLLCPFHYFGITDLAIIGDDEEASRDFSVLTSDERVKHIIKSSVPLKQAFNEVRNFRNTYTNSKCRNKIFFKFIWYRILRINI